MFDQLINVVETGVTLDEEIYYSSEPVGWYHVIAIKLGDGFTITIRDISAKKQRT
jgi:hypothetical protein